MLVVSTPERAGMTGGPGPAIPRRRIVRALAGTRPPRESRAAAPGPARPAAVLVPLIERDDGFSVLFIEKARGLVHHAGQVGFPGGRIEPADGGPVEAALREAYEEIALPAEAVEIAGFLPVQRTLSSGYTITPVVALVADRFTAVPDSREVAAVFEEPLAYFLDPGNARAGQRRPPGVRGPVWEFHCGGRRIWGATAAILSSLVTRLRGE